MPPLNPTHPTPFLTSSTRHLCNRGSKSVLFRDSRRETVEKQNDKVISCQIVYEHDI